MLILYNNYFFILVFFTHASNTIGERDTRTRVSCSNTNNVFGQISTNNFMPVLSFKNSLTLSKVQIKSQ